MINNEEKSPITSDKITQSEDKVKKPAKTVKKERVPVFKQKSYDYTSLNLDFKNFHYHWVNSSAIMGNNVERYLRAGYEHVIGEDKKNISRRIGKFEDGFQYMMRIPMDLFLLDQHDKLQEVRQIEADMGVSAKQQNPSLPSSHIYGSIKVESHQA
jgi:hypothetical protein